MGRDPEYLAFMRHVAAAVAAADPTATVEQRRAGHVAGLAGVPRTPMAEQRDVVVDGRLPGRLYRPVAGGGQPGLVFFHGGGWHLGSVAAYDPVVQALAAASGVTFLSVGCRLAPENPFPAAVEDAVAAAVWTVRHAAALGLDPARLGVAGDSSGGNLAAVATRRLARGEERGGEAAREERGGEAAGEERGGRVRLAAQVLLYPALDLRTLPEPIADPDGLEWPAPDGAMRHGYLAGADPADPDASPLAAPDLERLPPALIVTPEYDVLRRQGIAYAERLREAGVPVAHLDCRGLDHAFLAWGHFARRPREATREVGEAISRLLGAAAPGRAGSPAR